MTQSKNVDSLLAHTPAIVAAGERAAAEAVRRAKANGLNIHYIEDGYLIEEAPNGSRKVLKPIDPVG
ncbi:hypothetical protein [Dyella subtropica]|uniref:hypothetical protein n=1 Tax=Dyella subtropica TaxID=2992127 RepID=UPI002252785C|nr:hypothetical protein [Dyella subtropica]